MFIQRYNNDSRVFAALQVLTLLLRINIVVSEETNYCAQEDWLRGAICRVDMSSHFGAVVFCLYGTDDANRREFLKTISKGESHGRRLLTPFFVGTSIFVLFRDSWRDREAYRIIARCTTICVKALKNKRRFLKRDPEISLHPWLSILLTDHRTGRLSC